MQNQFHLEDREEEYYLLTNASALMFVWIEWIIIKVRSRHKDDVECAAKTQEKDVKSVDAVFTTIASKHGMELIEMTIRF